MQERDSLSEQFEANRQRLRGVAFRMLGSFSEAEDAVQEAWIRLNSSEGAEISNLGGWLTTVVARISLDMLRSRKARREELLEADEAEHILNRDVQASPEQEALLAEAIGIALLVVLERLEPVERLAFVLHDLFAIPFDDIAPIIGRSTAAARQIASRARRQVQGTPDATAAKSSEQLKVVSAFFAASRDGNFDALLKLLDPDVELTVDASLLPKNVPQHAKGADLVARRARWGADRMRSAGVTSAHLMRVDGSVGIVVAPSGRLYSVMAFEIKDGKISTIRIIGETSRLNALKLTLLDDQPASAVSH